MKLPIKFTKEESFYVQPGVFYIISFLKYTFRFENAPDKLIFLLDEEFTPDYKTYSNDEKVREVVAKGAALGLLGGEANETADLIAGGRQGGGAREAERL